MHFSEDILQFIWRKRAFDHSALQTTAGDPIAILDVGQHNRNAGPDFLNARIRIGELEWIGNVELHLKSSLWKDHGHQNDPAYENVILHVVLEDDDPLHTGHGKPIPTIELAGRIDTGMIARYTALMSNLDDVPCRKMLPNVERIKIMQWMDRMLVQRLERKAQKVEALVSDLDGDLNRALFVALCRSMGAKVNAEAFERMARNISLKTLMVHRNDPMQLEALLYGTASLLRKEHHDGYAQGLHKEFQFLKRKYGLRSINSVEWKWHRIRPSGFPTLRISQLATLIGTISHSLGELLEMDRATDILDRLRVPANDYWSSHSRFDRPCNELSTLLGTSAAQNLIINTIVPFQFHIAEYRGRQEMKVRAISLLEQLKPENNRIIKRWKELGVDAMNAADTQALIELYNLECLNKKCLFCGIGSGIIGKGEHTSKSPQTL